MGQRLNHHEQAQSRHWNRTYWDYSIQLAHSGSRAYQGRNIRGETPTDPGGIEASLAFQKVPNKTKHTKWKNLESSKTQVVSSLHVIPTKKF